MADEEVVNQTEETEEYVDRTDEILTAIEQNRTPLNGLLWVCLFLAIFCAGVVAFYLVSTNPPQHPWKGQQTKYTAYGTVMGCARTAIVRDQKVLTDVTIVAMRTPDNLYFTIPFINQNELYVPNVEGTLRYHACGPDVYCADSFQAKESPKEEKKK